MPCRLLFSGWGSVRVSLVVDYTCGQYINKRQWCTIINILWITVGCLNATIIRITQKPEPQIGTNMSSQPRQNPWVDRYGYRFGLPWSCGSGHWIGLELNRMSFAVRTRTSGRLPRPIAHTIEAIYTASFGLEFLTIMNLDSGRHMTISRHWKYTITLFSFCCHCWNWFSGI